MEGMGIEKGVYTVDEAAQRLGISRGLCYRLTRQKKLPGALHLGEKRMVLIKSAIDALLNGGQPKS